MLGVLCAPPYILYQLFRFVSPALYSDERRYVVRVIGSSYLMFIIGVLVSYYLIFPLTFRFLGTYQVASDVENMISLESYMSTLIMMCLSMGIVFEILGAFMAIREIRISERTVHASVSASCHSHHIDSRGSDHPYLRHLHPLSGLPPDVVALRSQHPPRSPLHTILASAL